MVGFLLTLIFRRAFRVIGIGFAMFVYSFDMKSPHRISRKRFDLESPNFTQTSIPTLSTVVPDMTSFSTSGRKLQRKTVENTAFNGFGWNFSRTIQARIMKFKFTCLSRATGPTNLPEMTPPVASGRLQNVIEYCTKVGETGPAGPRVE